MILVIGLLALGFAAAPVLAADQAPSAVKPLAAKPNLDRSGKKKRGKASYYSRKFAGKKMADGTPMDPKAPVAASKTLPLGTRARVTNLETGQSAVVEIRDRGPYVPGRTIDLAPSVAADIGLTKKQGVAPVEVAPIEVPQRDGTVKLGEGAPSAITGR
jgi:rare lipoprotein A